MKPKETVQALLNDIRNPKTVRDLCVQDVTYVSLNYSNPDLHKIMPWCGTGKGVVAHTIHVRSLRAAGPFVTIHCPSLSAELDDLGVSMRLPFVRPYLRIHRSLNACSHITAHDRVCCRHQPFFLIGGFVEG